MSIDRYTRDDEGFRKYLELLESTPTAKRQKFIASARAENPAFVDAIEKYLLTFERITKLPDMELTELLGDPGLKVEVVSAALCSVSDAAAKERMVQNLPRDLAPKVLMQMKEFPDPSPQEAGGSRLKVIQMARELEKNGKLKSVQIPHFGVGHFSRKAA